MHGYVLRRLLALVPTLFFASLIVFVIVRIIPGNVIDLMLSQNDIAVGKDRAQIEAALGLDQRMHVQYFRWASGAVRGDLGRSLWQSTPVTTTQLLELRAGAVRPGPIYARIWIDHEMKKRMGF